MNQIIRTIRTKAALLAVTLGLAGSLVFAGALPAQAATDCGATPEAPKCQVQKGINKSGGTGADNDAGALTGFIKTIVDILLFLIGAIAVIMIIIGGIRYVTSNGDQGQVTGAKNTILYAIVGLVVAIMAYAIVNFVVSKL